MPHVVSNAPHHLRADGINGPNIRSAAAHQRTLYSKPNQMHPYQMHVSWWYRHVAKINKLADATLLLRGVAASCSVPLQQAPLALVARALTRLFSRNHALLLAIRCGKSVHTQALGPFPRELGMPKLLRPNACIRNVVPKLLLSLAQAVSCESTNITGTSAGLPSPATVYSFCSQTDGLQQCAPAAQRLNAAPTLLPQSCASGTAFTRRMRHSLTPSILRFYYASTHAFIRVPSALYVLDSSRCIAAEEA